MIETPRTKEDIIKVINGELYYLGDYTCYLYQELEKYQLIIKALHKYLQEHEDYETNELLRQLENCSDNDIEWLKKIGSDK